MLDLLEAARRLHAEGVRFRLLISGIGPTFDETEAAILHLGLQDCVSMTGYVDYAEAPAVYRRASIFVSPTYAEGFSNTILEAMASRMAVVSCRSVGVVDCIRDGENGLLTEPGDIAALTAALGRALQDPALRERLAEAALTGMPRGLFLAQGRRADHGGIRARRRRRARSRLADRAADRPLPLPRRAASAVTRTALFVSPHLDDVAFSCGGTLALLADRGWRTVLATAFTRTVLPATGFALACQLDKGLAPEIDYMALRREEDRAAAAILGVAELRWLDLPEAPHRGYGSAAALFGRIRPGDEVWRPLADALDRLVDAFDPEQIFAPQGLGGHVDHRQTIRAVQAAAGGAPVAWYRDAPYAIREPDAAPFVNQPDAGSLRIEGALRRKIEAASAYRSQIGFQFGGPDGVAEALADFAERDGGERFCGNFNKGLRQP